MFSFLLVIHSLIAAALVGVILMQRSEGGGFAGGGSPTGLLSARGAGDFLTRTTAILATLFIVLSIGLSALATVNRRPTTLDNSLKRAPISNPAAAIPSVPMAGGAAPVTPPVAGSVPAPQPAPSLGAVDAKTQQSTPATVTREETRDADRAARVESGSAKPSTTKPIVIAPRAPVAVPKVVAPAPAQVAPKVDAAPPPVNATTPAPAPTTNP